MVTQEWGGEMGVALHLSSAKGVDAFPRQHSRKAPASYPTLFVKFALAGRMCTKKLITHQDGKYAVNVLPGSHQASS